MTGRRTRYSAELNAHVALDVLRGELTTARLAAKHGVYQTMAGEWKRLAMESMVAVFSGRSAAQESAKAAEAEIEKLHARNSRLLVEWGRVGLHQLR